jgi:glucosamine--fructose-6-phosphate aminotransferase (isomerizing)
MEIRDKHPYFMYEEIINQPDYIEKTIKRYLETDDINQLASKLYNSKRIFLIGCGTSYHVALSAGTISHHLFKEHNPIKSVQAFELMQQNFNLNQDDCIIAFTHSGETHMTNEAINFANKKGCKTLVITAFPSSTSGEISEFLLPTLYEDEKSLAHTISYTLSYVNVLLLLSAIAEKRGVTGSEKLTQNEIKKLPNLLREILNQENEIKEVANLLANKKLWVLLGTGTSLGVASEIALKSIETHYVPSINYDLEHSLHGVLPMCDNETVFILILPNKDVIGRTKELLKAIKHLKSDSLILSSEEKQKVGGNHYLKMSKFNEILCPVVSVVPLQLLTYFVSLNKELNPDLIRRDNSKYQEARDAYV